MKRSAIIILGIIISITSVIFRKEITVFFNNDRVFPMLFFFIGIVLILYGVIINIIIPRIWRGAETSAASVEMEEEPIVFTKTGYASDSKLNNEDDFIAYACKYAETKKCPKDSGQKVFDFLLNNLEAMRLGYVFETGKVLMINNIPTTFYAIILKYCGTKN